jgi:hypothetical protein
MVSAQYRLSRRAYAFATVSHYASRSPTFLGQVFSRVVIMPIVFASIMPLPLLPQNTLSGQGHLYAWQEQGLFLKLQDSGPGFRHQVAHGQRRLVEQLSQDADPALAKDTHEPQACGTPCLRLPRCLFRKSGARRTSCPRRRASSPYGARLLDSRLRE